MFKVQRYILVVHLFRIENSVCFWNKQVVCGTGFKYNKQKTHLKVSIGRKV